MPKKSLVIKKKV